MVGHQRLKRGQRVAIMDVGFKEYCKRLFMLYTLAKTEHIIKEAECGKKGKK